MIAFPPGSSARYMLRSARSLSGNMLQDIQAEDGSIRGAIIYNDQAPFDVEFIGLPGEEIPLDDGSIDSVLMTYTLCSIPDTETALPNPFFMRC